MDDSTVTVNTLGEYVFPNEPVFNRNVRLVKRAWASFHNSIIIALLFSLLGISIGVKVSKDFYIEKLTEVVQTGAMLHKQKVYLITPKI